VLGFTRRNRYEVLGYKNIIGNSSLRQAASLYYMKQTGMRYQQVKISLNNSAVRLEAGALHYMRGDITMDTDFGNLGKFFKRGLSALATGETIIKPVYKGTGDVFLEPSFGHYLLVHLEDFALVCDDGMFLACDESIQVTALVQKSLGAGFFGGEGWVQPKLEGNGICLLKSPVPFDELVRVQLNNDTLKVDGSFAVARLGNIDFRVEKSTKSLLGSVASGEGLLQTFHGTGEVWLNPTEGLHRGPMGV
jgi:uncharacterized protein (AIM24 family)